MPKGYYKIKIDQGKVAFEEIQTDSYDDEFESLSDEKSCESDIDTDKVEKNKSMIQENNIGQQITKQLSFSTDDEKSKVSITEEINCSENINDQLINDLLKQDSQVNLEEWDILINNKDIVGEFKENEKLLLLDNNNKTNKEEITRKNQTNLIEELAEVKS